MNAGEINQIESDLEELWNSYRAQPSFIQMTLANFRKLCNDYGALPHAREFLERTAAVPGTAVICMGEGTVELLTDKDGNLVEFA